MIRITSCLPILIVFLFGTTTVTLGRNSEVDTVKNLLRDLKNPRYEVAWSAPGELSAFPQYKSQIVPGLIEALQYEWDNCSGDIRDAIASTLLGLKAKESVFPLLELLRSGKNIGHECAECGCCFLVLTPADELVYRYFDPFCETNVLTAIYQMADFSHSKAIADIISEGKGKPGLIMVLGKVGLPRYAYFISQYKDNEAVGVRVEVAVALGLIENDDITIPVLVQLLTKRNEDFYVRWEASNSLIKIGKRNGNQFLKSRLMNLLDEEDKMSGVLAARILGFLGQEKGLLKLRSMANDEDAKIRSEAVMYLGEVSDAGSKDILIKNLKDESLVVRACAMYALGQIGDVSMVPILKKGFENSETYQTELEKKIVGGANAEIIRQKYGYQVFDLRETMQRAIEGIQERASK